MKKIILAVLVSLMLPSFSFAQLADIDPTGMSSSCIVLNNNMNYRTRDISTNNEVSMLQDFLNSEGYLSVEPTGYFGLQTVAAAKKFQSASGFSPTGYVGPLTRGKIKEMTCGDTSTTTSSPAPITVTTNYSNLPAGCTSDRGYSTTTGKRCLVTVAPVINYSSYPAGCLSSSGYSSLTGNRCDGSVPVKPVYLSGCTSTSGWSSTTGKACDGSTKQNPAYPAGCLSASGYSSIDGRSCGANAVAPVISSIGSKGLKDGDVYAGADAYINGSGLKGSLTVNAGGRIVYVNSLNDNYATFTTPVFPMYPAEGVEVTVINNTTNKKSNAFKVTVRSMYPAGCSSFSGWSSIDGSSCSGSAQAKPVASSVVFDLTQTSPVVKVYGTNLTSATKLEYSANCCKPTTGYLNPSYDNDTVKDFYGDLYLLNAIITDLKVRTVMTDGTVGEWIAVKVIALPRIVATFTSAQQYNTSKKGEMWSSFAYRIENYRPGLVLDVEPIVNCNDTYILPTKRDCSQYLMTLSGKAAESYTNVEGSPYVKSGAVYRFTGADGTIGITSFVNPSYVTPSGYTDPVPDNIDFKFILRDTNNSINPTIWSETDRAQFKG